MTTSLKTFGRRVISYARRQLRMPEVELDEPTRRFVAHNRIKWRRTDKVNDDAVVLVGLFDFRPSVYCYSYVTNHLARKTGARIESYQFGRRNHTVDRVFESFGATFGLGSQDCEAFREKAGARADEIFRGLKSTWDVLAITEGGIKLGDLIYDSYMRYFLEPTVRLTDERLRKVIFDALLILYATAEYFQRKRVTAFIADDYGYISCGIPTRVAMREKVPTYIVCYGERFFVYELFGEAETGWHDYPIRWPYHHYREIFRKMPPDEQERGREVGRQHLLGKLNGKADKFTLQTISAYGESEGRIFEPTGKARVVILLHDFVDAPHGYRDMLFPDFYEWIHFLLERAENTPFEWYLKPHPWCWDATQQQINNANAQVVEDLKARYKKIKFLDPKVSNRQMISEGLNAMFTVYGTAGHEFAYLGVPVVNAGDNPHIAYDFNFHPKTVDEYAGFIERADRLKIEVNKTDIEEFYYMNNFHFADHLSKGANPMAESIFRDPDFEAKIVPSSGYDFMMEHQNPANEAKLEAYLDESFAKLKK